MTELSSQQRANRPLACRIVEKALSFLTGTQELERWLGEVTQMEQKSRQHHLSPWNLEAGLKLNVQCFQGRRIGKTFAPDDLFDGPSASAMKARGPVKFYASPYGIQVQHYYKMFFGAKKLPGRALEGDRPRRRKTKAGKNLQGQQPGPNFGW